MDKKKLDADMIKSLVSGVVAEDKPYDLNLALNTLELVSQLKNKITEDFAAIDAIKEKLADVSVASKVLEHLDFIVTDLHSVENRVNILYNYLKPKN